MGRRSNKDVNKIRASVGRKLIPEKKRKSTAILPNEKKKRHRRTATEIARCYKCPITDCPKSYGGEGALNQHLKLKHKAYYEEMIKQNNANQSFADLGAVAIGGIS